MATGTTNVSTSSTGDGSTTEFSFDWRVLDATNVKVKTIDGDDLTESDLEYGVDYTVAVNTNGVGGTVTFSSAPADGDEVFIYRETPLVQSLELEGIGNLSEKSLEQSYDRAMLIAQELLDKVNRAITLASNSTSAFDLTLPADLATANAVLAVNATGDGLKTGPTTTEIENAESNATEAAASATAAAASAASAASSAANTASALASAFFSDVVFYNAASSPVTLDSDANGKLHVFDSSAGAITVNLPEISGETMPFNMAVLCSADGNDVTFNRGGSSDTIQGGASKVLNVANTGFQLIADTDPTPDTWSVLEFGSVGDGTVTKAKLADNAKGRRKVTTTGADLTLTDSHDIIVCTAPLTLTIPSASSANEGREYTIINKSSSFLQAITLSGGVTAGLHTAKETLKIVSTGSAWEQVERQTASGVFIDVPSFTAVTTNPTFGTITVQTLRCSRYGVYLDFELEFKQITPGTAGNGQYRIDIPFGLNADTSKYGLASETIGGNARGNGFLTNNTTGDDFQMIPNLDSSGDYIRLILNQGGGSASFWNSASFSGFGAPLTLSVFGRIPINGWNT